jgi:endonuclease YncB( thermonuclease family)
MLSLVCATPAAAMIHLPRDAGLTTGGTGVVAEIIDGDTLKLADGRTLRLAGLRAPKSGVAGRHAARRLTELAAGHVVRLFFAGLPRDRWRQVLAHLERDDGLWLQGALLAEGAARVQTRADVRAAATAMLRLEAAARRAGRGIWRNPAFAVRRADSLGKAATGFQIVEGRILRARRIKGRVYLNFGADWHTDFTVSLAPAARRLFVRAGLNPQDWSGRYIRVRGWIKNWNGPMIEATHPEQIEVLDGLDNSSF